MFELVTELSVAKSQSGGTSLITMYIVDKQLWLAKNKLKQELSTASNIKDKTVRKDVQTALKSAIIKLSEYKNSYTNGLVLCAGQYL